MLFISQTNGNIQTKNGWFSPTGQEILTQYISIWIFVIQQMSEIEQKITRNNNTYREPINI